MSSEASPSEVEVVPTTIKHIVELAHTMRQEDRDEIWHLARLNSEQSLKLSYEVSSHVRTVTLNKRVVCIFGMAGEGTTGYPWMLASPLLTKIRKTFLRQCREQLAEISGGRERLMNVAWSKNTEHIRWLKWLGFQLDEPIPLGPDRELYIPFSKVILNVHGANDCSGDCVGGK